MCNISYIKEKKEGDSLKRRKVKSIKQLGNTGTQLEKEVAAMEEAMKQHNIEENCQKLIDCPIFFKVVNHLLASC